MAPLLAITPAPANPLKRKHVELEDHEERQAYGQPIPSWMSWARIPFEEADGSVGTSTWLVELPQLYTGPSIPLAWPWTSETAGVDGGGVVVSVLEGARGAAAAGLITLGGTGPGAIPTAIPAGRTGTPATGSGTVRTTTGPRSSESRTGAATSSPTSRATSRSSTEPSSTITSSPSTKTTGSSTGTSSSSTSTLPATTAPFDNHNRLSAGAIAGIAIGAFAFFLLIVIGLAAFLVHRRRREARANFVAARGFDIATDGVDDDAEDGAGGGRRAWIQGRYQDHPPHSMEAAWKAGATGATFGAPAGALTAREMGNLPPRSSQDGQVVDDEGHRARDLAYGAGAGAAAIETDRLLRERDLGDGASSHYPSSVPGDAPGLVIPSNVHLSSGDPTHHASVRTDDSLYDPDFAEGERTSLLGVGGDARRRSSRGASPRSPQDDPEWLGPGAIARAVGAYEVGRRALSFRGSSKSSPSSGRGRGGPGGSSSGSAGRGGPAGSSSGRTGTGPSSGNLADGSSGGTSVMTDDLFAIPPGGAARETNDGDAWRHDVATPADRMGRDAVSAMGVLAGGMTAAAAARRRNQDAIAEESESSIDDPHSGRPHRRRSTDLPPYSAEGEGVPVNRPSASSSRTNFSSRSHTTSNSFSDIDENMVDHQGRRIPPLVGHGTGFSTTFAPPVPYFPQSSSDSMLAPVMGGGRLMSINPEAFANPSYPPGAESDSSGEQRPKKKRGSSIMAQWAPDKWGVAQQENAAKRVSTIQEGSENGSGTGNAESNGSSDKNGSSNPNASSEATPGTPADRLVSPATGGGTGGPLSTTAIGGLFGGLRAMVTGVQKRDSGASLPETPATPEPREVADDERTDHRHPILRHSSSQQRVTTTAMGFPGTDLDRLANTETRGDRPVSHIPEVVHPNDDSSELYRHPEDDSSGLYGSGDGPESRHPSMQQGFGDANRWSHATMGQRIRDEQNQTSSSSGGHPNSLSSSRKEASGSGSGGHGTHSGSGSGSGQGHQQGSSGSQSRVHAPIEEEHESQIEVPEVLSS